jgi:hypothetical protein
MAKIVLLGRHLHHTVWPLAQSLQAQQHQVYLVTSRDVEVHESSADVSVMTFFKTWSAWEALKFIPILLNLNPQIFHLVLEKDHVSAAEWLLAYVAQTLPHCVVTTSFLDPERGLRKKTWLKFLVQHSDIVTCPSIETLGHLRGLQVHSRRQNRGLLPPILDSLSRRAPQNAKATEELSLLTAKIKTKQTLALPFTLDPDGLSFQLKVLLRQISTQRHILLLGSWDSWPVRTRKKLIRQLEKNSVSWTLSGFQTSEANQQLLSACEALWLAELTLSPTSYTEYIWLAWQSGITPVIDTSQAIMHSGIWKDGINCHILKKNRSKSEVDRILSLPNLRTPEHLSPQCARDLIDHSTNDLNRLYNKALSEKAVS